MRRRAGVLLAALIAIVGSTEIRAQDHVALRTDILFYGDNTEFRNPFREGETIFGAAPRVSVEASIADRATLELGVFANQRFGSDDAFELVRPIVALTIRGHRSRFVFGTLPPSRAGTLGGPDLDGPHALLPPLQRETLSFDRPYEAGFAWTFSGNRLRHEIWLDWQKVNTPEHRERFDAGMNGDLKLGSHLTLPIQLFIVHQGGQLFSSGPVADSFSGAAGIRFEERARVITTLEAFGLAARFVPDRSRPSRTQRGAAFLARGAVEYSGFRGHLIVWRGDDFVTEEGDRNYHSLRRDGTRYGGVRDYAEVGLTRTFKVVPGVILAASARFHRIENYYEYSYRILAATALSWRLK
ncbi:MAG TPA: hypothetical protein VHI99_01165 [Vicinamibacterales bacterium]|nr:hypothetical protein [Vicinamibacterales bacterium]